MYEVLNTQERWRNCKENWGVKAYNKDLRISA
jgi:hypothetical protein